MLMALKASSLHQQLQPYRRTDFIALYLYISIYIVKPHPSPAGSETLG